MATDFGTAGLGLDFLMQIINVHWGGGVFSFAGSINLDVVTPPSENSMGSVKTHLTSLGGTSSDGKTWKSSSNENGISLLCCVGGKVGKTFVIVAAGGVVVGPFSFSGYATTDGIVPAAAVSDDDGLTWSNAGIPLQEHVLNPPDPETGRGADSASGICNAVAYHPGTQTFYVGGSVFFSVGADIYWEDRMYISSGSGFAQVYSERRELSDPFLGYKWPEVDRLRVADSTRSTELGPGIKFVVSFGPGQQVEHIDTAGNKIYVAVKAEGKGATMGEQEINPPIAYVNSITAGRGAIVAVGWEDEDRFIGPVTFVSLDDGQSWKAQLSDLTNTAPEPGNNNIGGNSGSCSFSKYFGA